MTNKTTTTTTQATLNKAFSNAKLDSNLEREVYKVGNDIHNNKVKGIKLNTNQAELMDTLIAECVKADDFSAIERIGLKHKTFDFKNDNLGEKGEPLNCKAFKTAISKAFNRAELDLSLQGCGKGGTPKVDAKQAPKGNDKSTGGDKEAEAEAISADKITQGICESVVGFNADELSVLMYDLFGLMTDKEQVAFKQLIEADYNQ